MIDISNSFDGNLIKSRIGKLESTKKEKILHGIGMDSVMQTVSKYGGVFSLRMKKILLK